jgi:hypothetical protein
MDTPGKSALGLVLLPSRGMKLGSPTAQLIIRQR